MGSLHQVAPQTREMKEIENGAWTNRPLGPQLITGCVGNFDDQHRRGGGLNF
jgi:hypothetical protein